MQESEIMKKYLSEYKNSVTAFYTHIFILFTSFIVTYFLHLDFESGEECILAIIFSGMYFLSGVFFLKKGKSEKLFRSLIPFFIYIAMISILAPLSGDLSMFILFINTQGIVFVEYISNLFDIDLWDGITYLIASPCPVICLYLGGLLKFVLKSKHKILAACCIGVICCIGLIAVCMFFWGTDKIPSGNGAFFATENKSGKAVYIWDVSSGETYRQTIYSFTGCYGDVYTDGCDLYYTKYDGKGGVRGLYHKPVNAGAGHEKTVTTSMLEDYRIGPDLVAYTVNDMDCNKLYICKIENGRETKLTDTCGNSFAVSGQTVCYYDLKDRMIKLENIETGTCTEIEYAKEPGNITATGKSEFALVSQTGMFCLIDASDEAVRAIDRKESDPLISVQGILDITASIADE